MVHALVTDGHWRKTLAAVRSLGRHGISVTTCESHPVCTSRFSRYCSRFVVSPPVRRETEYLEFLRREFRRGCDFLLPMEEETCLLVARHRDLVPRRTGLVLPTYEQMTEIRDKKNALVVAQRLGIPAPKTYSVHRAKDLRSLPLPLIVRPRTGSGTVGIRYASTHDEAEQAWRGLDDPLVQEVIAPGRGLGVEVLMNFQSEPRALFVHERLRENPPRGGPSTLARSIRRPDAEEWAVRILREIRWVGVAMVEFRLDERDGVPKFIEINPRFWGTLQLSIAAGVDFPYLLWRLAREGDVEPVRDYRVGVYFRWTLPGDLLHFRRNPGRWRDLPQYARHWVGRDVTHAIFAWDDPLPVLGRVLSAPQFLSHR